MSRLVVFVVDHPHPDPKHVMCCYRGHILRSKEKWSSARGLIHYRQYVQTYLHCKQRVLGKE